MMWRAMVDEVSHREVYTWLKTFRGAIVGYERLAIMFKAIFACIMIYMRYGL